MNETADTVAAFRSAATSAPQAPSSLSASALSADSDRLTWSDNSSDEVGFTIERSGNGVDFAEIATLGAGTTSFVDTGLSARTTYWYRLNAFNGAGYSGFSGTVTVTTPDAAPAEPGEVAALNNDDGSASVTWIDESSNETGFEARRETWDARRGSWKNLTVVGTVPTGVTALVDMTGNGTFRYTVRALGSGTTSDFAGPAQVNVTGAPKSTGKGRGR
jgi:titin